jgi:hypothetical protein
MSMSLPFTHEQFLDVFGAYNSALWPAALLLWLLTAAGVVSLAGGRGSPRVLAALLAIHWLWSGAVYHLGYFAAINPAARVFGTLFIIEAGLIAWFGVLRARLEFAWGRGRGFRGALAVFFALSALAYPFLALAAGLHWPRTPTFGVPCPTTLLTVGFLLSVEPAHLRGLSVIPLAWSVVGGSAAILLGVLPDSVLLLAGAVLLLQLVAPRLLTGARAA